MTRFFKLIKRILLFALILGVLLFLLLLFPQPLFDYKAEFENITLYSDRPLPPNAPILLAEVSALLAHSALNDASIHQKVFICNDLSLFDRLTRGKGYLAGLCDDRLTRNVFIRPADVANNRILPPPGWKFSTDDRPLTYFIAHELTHSLESHYTGRWNLHVPKWLWEGYADYVGKGPVSYEAYLQQYKQHSPEMNPDNGLYTRYHLYLLYLLDRQHKDIKELLDHPPAVKDIELGLQQDMP